MKSKAASHSHLLRHATKYLLRSHDVCAAFLSSSPVNQLIVGGKATCVSTICLMVALFLPTEFQSELYDASSSVSETFKGYQTSGKHVEQ